MTYRLEVKITHKSFNEPMIKAFYYQGDSKADIMKQINTLPHHLDNLNRHGRTAFKDVNGVKHHWQLKLMPEMN